MPRKKPKTAAEFSADLERDPEYQVGLARREQDAEAQGEAAASDEQSLVADLQDSGIRIQSVYDLVNEITTPPEAVPHLLRHLDVPHLPIVREGILRALAYSHLRTDALESLKRFFTRAQAAAGALASSERASNDGVNCGATHFCAGHRGVRRALQRGSSSALAV